jgi:hypothetical protein
MDATEPVVLGAIIGWLYNKAVEKRENGEMLKRFGVLLASGLIVGESLLGVLNAGLIVGTNNAAPLALVGPEFAAAAAWVGAALFVAAIIVSYAWVSNQARPLGKA